MKIEQFENATLYLGDCREIMPGLQLVDAVITDPPYGISYVTNRRTVMEKPAAIANDTEAPLWSVPLMIDRVKDGGAIYLCTRFDVMAMWQEAITEAGATLKTPIVWDKGNHTSGDLTGDYGNQVELILFAHKGRHELKHGRPSNLWRVPKDQPGEHPTPKPVGLMARCIENSVTQGGIVLDPFMGSGSTGVAAVRDRRYFIGIEIEPKYFDIACRRIDAEDRQGSIFDFPGFAGGVLINPFINTEHAASLAA